MRNKAQSILEYSVLICIIVAALFAMRVYLKRGMQGRIRGYADELGGGFGYSPGAMNSASLIDRTILESTASAGIRIGDREKGSVSTTATNVGQDTNRAEEVLPFSAEPQRR